MPKRLLLPMLLLVGVAPLSGQALTLSEALRRADSAAFPNRMARAASAAASARSRWVAMSPSRTCASSRSDLVTRPLARAFSARRTCACPARSAAARTRACSRARTAPK